MPLEQALSGGEPQISEDPLRVGSVDLSKMPHPSVRRLICPPIDLGFYEAVCKLLTLCNLCSGWRCSVR